jgi:hypothetical protein
MDFLNSLNYPGTSQDLQTWKLEGFSPRCRVETRILPEGEGWMVRLQLLASHPMCRLQRRYIKGLRTHAEAQAIARLYEGLEVSSAAAIPLASQLLTLN